MKTPRLPHRCFSVNIAKFLRIPIFKNICKRLLFKFFRCSFLLIVSVMIYPDFMNECFAYFCKGVKEYLMAVYTALKKWKLVGQIIDMNTIGVVTKSS